MSKIALLTDTSCDLPPEIRKEHNVFLASMKVHFGEEEYTDQVTITHQQFYRKMAENPEIIPRTTQPQAKDFLELYQHLQEEGYSTVFSLHISRKMSGTIQAAEIAAGMMKEKEIEIIPVDTGQVGPPLGLFVYLVAERIKRGESTEEIKNFIEKLVRHKDLIFVAFTVNTMEYLVKNGRVGRAKGFAAGLLNIKPILTLEEGEITLYDKARGTKALLEKMGGIILEKMEKCKKPLLYVAWGDDSMKEIAGKVRENIEAECGRPFQLFQGNVAPTIGCHTGPELFALAVTDLALNEPE
ncbi:MAG: DegV family protein [Firmicutes bacterium]|nr:DegV family protein [Bacillota bacterium]